MKRGLVALVLVLVLAAAGCELGPQTSTFSPYRFARSSGTETVVYVIAPDTSGGLESELQRVIAEMDARPDLKVIRTDTDPGHEYNRIVVRRQPMNGAGVYDVWPLDDPNRKTDRAAGIVRFRWVFFDNAKPWTAAAAIRVVAHEIRGHALCSLGHPPTGTGPTVDGKLTPWDLLLCHAQLRAVVPGAPAGE